MAEPVACGPQNLRRRLAVAWRLTFRSMRFWAVMSSSISFLAVAHCPRTLSSVACDLARLACLAARPRAALVAENLLLVLT